MQPRGNGQRPDGRQSYSRYQPPIGGGSMRRPLSSQGSVVNSEPSLQPQAQSTEAPSTFVSGPVSTPQPARQVPVYSPPNPSAPRGNVTVLKPVWSVDPTPAPTTGSQTTPVAQSIQQPPALQPPTQPPASAPSTVQENTAPVQISEAPKILSFDAPKIQKKKKLPKIKAPRVRLRDLSKRSLILIGATIGVLCFSGAAYGVTSWQARRSDPSTILKNALTKHLSVKQIEVGSVSGVNTRTTLYDFENPKDVVVSSKFAIRQYGSMFNMSTYGDNQSTFIRYDSLPSAVEAKTKDAVVSKWIRLREKGKLPLDASHMLSSLADPRAQILGPMIYGNFDEKTSAQLADFMIKNKVYKIQSATPAKTKVDGKKVIVMPVEIDSGYLKVAMQSAALSLGYEPDDIAEAVRAMDFYKGASADIYITSRGHQIIKFVITTEDGIQTEISYKNIDKVKPEAQPSNSVAWKGVAPFIWQVDYQTAKSHKPEGLDNVRKNALDSLHANLASYRAQKGFYPTLAGMNDLSWLSTVALGAPEMQRDPLSTTLTLSPVPTPNMYAYLVGPATGAGACDNTKVPCLTYRLVAVLSDGKQYLVQNP